MASEIDFIKEFNFAFLFRIGKGYTMGQQKYFINPKKNYFKTFENPLYDVSVYNSLVPFSSIHGDCWTLIC